MSNSDLICLGLVAQQKDLLEAMRARGWNEEQTARFLGIPLTEFLDMLNLRVPDLDEFPAELSVRLWELTGKTAEQLFYPAVCRAKEFGARKRLAAGGKSFVGPDEGLLNKELAESVIMAVSALPGERRKVIGMIFFEELTLKQAAVELGKSPRTIRAYESRALRSLRPRLRAFA